MRSDRMKEEKAHIALPLPAIGPHCIGSHVWLRPPRPDPRRQTALPLEQQGKTNEADSFGAISSKRIPPILNRWLISA